jgi:hypothetical protein
MNIHKLNKIAWDHAVAAGSDPYNPAIAEGSDTVLNFAKINEMIQAAVVN